VSPAIHDTAQAGEDLHALAMTTQLILVRHGETEGQSSIRYHGRTDVPLSELGRAQMRAARDAIAEHYGPIDFARVFSSPLIRALEGAEIIAGESAPLSIIEDFAEVHFGLFEGLTAEEIRDRHPDHYAIWNVDRLASDYTYPEGENRAAFAERVSRGIDQMLALWAPDDAVPSRALVVAHRGVIRATVDHLTRNRPNVPLGSIQMLELRGDWRALELDRIQHLEGLQ
jgi:broad specificity phosphatase PhoE